MNVRVEPSFDPDPNSHIVLITHAGLDKSFYDAWTSLFTALRLPFQQFSVSRYGHFDPALPVLADGVPLARHLAGKTVIVPDTLFDIGLPTAPALRTPSWLLPGAAIRAHLLSPDYGAVGPPHYLFVSAQGKAPFSGLEHMIHPITPPNHTRIGGSNFGKFSFFKKALESRHFPGHAVVRVCV